MYTILTRSATHSFNNHVLLEENALKRKRKDINGLIN